MSRGSPEAEDVAQQHASPSLTVEGLCAVTGDLQQSGVRLEAPAAPRVPCVRSVRRPRRPPPGPLTGSVVSEPSYDDLRAALGGPDLDAGLLDRALTHRSFAYENGGVPTNERLEFLGDSVLGVVVTDTLYRAHPDLSEGRLAKLRAAVVNARALAGVARTIGLGTHIKLGRGEESTGGRDKSSILSDTVEAVIGAVYLSGGFDAASELVHRLFDPLMEAAAGLGAGLDWKTSLQELSAEHSLGVPEYVIEDEGPDHEKTFTAQVRVGEDLYGRGTGRSKKEAEQQAAETAYRTIAAERDSGARRIVDEAAERVVETSGD
jgi:ribonuclease-3